MTSFFFASVLLQPAVSVMEHSHDTYCSVVQNIHSKVHSSRVQEMQGTEQLSEDRHSQRLPGSEISLASRDQPCQQRSVAHALNPFLLWRQWPSSKETLQGLALEEQGNGTVGRLLSPGDKSTLPAKKPPHQSCPCCIGRLGVLQVQCTFKHCLAHRRVEQLAERLPVVSISQRLRYYNSEQQLYHSSVQILRLFYSV